MLTPTDSTIVVRVLDSIGTTITNLTPAARAIYDAAVLRVVVTNSINLGMLIFVALFTFGAWINVWVKRKSRSDAPIAIAGVASALCLLSWGMGASDVIANLCAPQIEAIQSLKWLVR